MSVYFFKSAAKILQFGDIRKKNVPFGHLPCTIYWIIWSFGYLTLRIVDTAVALNEEETVTDE